MHGYNSDGYILIDMKEADITQSSQYIPGIYNRIVEEVTKANKLAVVINAGKLTPMAAAINKMLNYYVITTSLYIFKVNTNDIVIIEQAGSSTVEVSIVPTLLSGTKIADYAIGDQEGSLYVPEFQTEINDSVKSDHLTWSSDKIDTQLGTKANSDDLSTVATTGSYTDLTDKPTIPTKVSELQNDSGYITDSALSDYQTKQDTNLQTTSNTVVGAINEINGKLIKRVSETIQLSQVTFTQSNSGMYYYEKTLNLPSGSLIVSISCGNWGKLRSTDIIEPYIAGSNKLGLMSNIDTFLNDAVIELIVIYNN